MSKINYIDLFAGAGGLSEGFMRKGFKPIAHVEMNGYACETLKTRVAYHHLKKTNQLDTYTKYLKKEIDRDTLWNSIPKSKLNSVINTEISSKTINDIFNQIDKQLNNKKVDIIIGGPPCQAYSLVGRARDPQSMENDPRNYLYKLYIKFLKKYQPKIFVFENVPGILSAKNGEQFEKIKRAISRVGYKFDFKILNARDFNVLQDRKRVILIGWKKDVNFSYPEFEKNQNSFQILKDLFDDLPSLKHGTGKDYTFYKKPINEYLESSHIRNGLDFTTQHIARPHNDRDLEIYRRAITSWLKERKRLNYAELPKHLQTHKNITSFLNRYQVVDPYSVCHTVVAHIAGDGHYYIYPDLKQIRSISIREAARIQSFPDDFYFEGGRTASFKQIGNAVPPLMAEIIAEKIKDVYRK